MPRAPLAPKTDTPSALPAAPANLFCGTSGWAYPSWKPGFYPADVPARAFLPFYSSRLTSVEVNHTFRKLPDASVLQPWLDAVPAGFRFSFKAPQRITHFQRLLNSQDALEEFIAFVQPARKAGKLGALLFQLPPNFKANHDRLGAFLALRCLRREPAQQIAFEFRHDSWFTEDTYSLLRTHNAALCVAESDALTTPDVPTANHLYYRLRMPGGYTPRRLKAFAERFTELSAVQQTYVYFKHEDDPTGPQNASSMLRSAAKIAGLS